MIDCWYIANKVVTVMIASEDDGECYQYFTHHTAFGLPTEVIDCSVMIMEYSLANNDRPTSPNIGWAVLPILGNTP